MSTEEIRELLPITLKEHNPNYKDWYENEKQSILNTIGNENIARINHIGSSAVKGLIAKPIVDITLEIDGCCNIAQLFKDLQAIGWELLRQAEDSMMAMFIKGYSFIATDGFAEKVYHLHVKYLGNWNELYFRDYLLTHRDVAAEYGNLKQRILKGFEHNTSIFEHEYGDAKSEFIKKYTDMAKIEFKDRYKPK